MKEDGGSEISTRERERDRKKRKTNMVRRKERARTAEERSCTKFPVYGNASSGTEAGWSVDLSIDRGSEGPRVIVTTAGRPRDKRLRKNTETHERDIRYASDREETEKEKKRWIRETMERSGGKK